MFFITVILPFGFESERNESPGEYSVRHDLHLYLSHGHRQWRKSSMELHAEVKSKLLIKKSFPSSAKLNQKRLEVRAGVCTDSRDARFRPILKVNKITNISPPTLPATLKVNTELK